MSRERIVPLRVQCCTGDGAESSQHEAESPSFFAHLSDYQVAGIAAFCKVHCSCELLSFVPTWDGSLMVVEEIQVSCPDCGEDRTYLAKGGELIA